MPSSPEGGQSKYECVTFLWPGYVILIHSYELETLYLPGNHDIHLRQVTLSVVGIKDFGSQDHFSFHGYYSLRPAYTQTNRCIPVTWSKIQKLGSLAHFFVFTCTLTPCPRQTPPRSDLRGERESKQRASKNATDGTDFKVSSNLHQTQTSQINYTQISYTHTLRLSYRIDILISCCFAFHTWPSSD